MAATRRRLAKLPTGKTFQGSGPDQCTTGAPTQRSLRELDWIRRRGNLALAGPSGTGKSYFNEVLAIVALDAGHTVAWHTLKFLGNLVRAHTVDHTVAKSITALVCHDLIVIDDIGLLPFSEISTQAFYRVADGAHGRTSIAVTSNIHPSGFEEFMPPTLATATMTGCCIMLVWWVTSGESVRLTQAKHGQGVGKLT